MPKRAVIMVIDALGAGSMPDWSDYDEASPSNTLKSTCAFMHENGFKLELPNLQELGIANLEELPGLSALERPKASFGKMAELNPAKDTITGHWEMMGIKAIKPFPYYPQGFPEEILEEFKKQTGAKGILGNCTASGTTIINELGDEHARTAYPIIYTSADSVLQIACDVDVIPLETLYKWCQISREIMRGKHEVARIIARPYQRNPNHIAGSSLAAEMKYIRLGDKRHDYSVLPHSKSVLEYVEEHNGLVTGLGKIEDIFATVGISQNIHTKNNLDGLDKLIKHLSNRPEKNEVVFINLVETDSNFGHRRDPEGFAKALEDIDKRIPELLANINKEDIFMISADHGCDPTAAGSDHTREYVPIIFYQPELEAKDLGIRESFADIGASIIDWFDIENAKLSIPGKSLVNA